MFEPWISDSTSFWQPIDMAASSTRTTGPDAESSTESEYSLYLDSASATPVRREALEAAWPYLTGNFGNPSSQHEIGKASALALDDARSRVAQVLGLRSTDIIFTSGGTEANNLAIIGIALGANPPVSAPGQVLPRSNRRHIVVSPLEHEAVLASARYLRRRHGFDITEVDVDTDGVVTTQALSRALRDDTVLVSLGYANNEIGTVTDIATGVRLAHDRGALFHTDAVAAAGWLPLGGLGTDAMSIAGHKIGAPKGIGVAAIRARVPIEPLIHGGGQEAGRRSGTENVALAVAFATALELAETERAEAADRVLKIRDDFISEVTARVPGAVLTGSERLRTPNHASFTFSSTSGESMLLELESSGVRASSGSACAAGSDEPSHVLVALGIDPEVAKTSVRFTFTSGVTAAQGRRAAAAVISAADRLALRYATCSRS